MNDQEFRDVLLCGGPNHGEWVKTPTSATAHYVREIKSMAFPFAPSGNPIQDFNDQHKDHRYYIEPVTMVGARVIWVGIHSDVLPMDWDSIVARAVLQRDVYSKIY